MMATNLTDSTNYCGKWIRHTSWYPDQEIETLGCQKRKMGRY